MTTNEPSGWTAIPHGLWTLPASHSAKVLLGWMWSHNDAFLQRMSISEAARQLHWSRNTVTRALDELADGGLVNVNTDTTGGASAVIHLDGPAWQALHHRLTIHLPEPVDNSHG